MGFVFLISILLRYVVMFCIIFIEGVCYEVCFYFYSYKKYDGYVSVDFYLRK